VRKVLDVTERALPKRRRTLVFVLLGAAIAVILCVIAVLAATGAGWFARASATHQVELRVESSTDFDVVYRYWSSDGQQRSVEESASQEFTVEFDAGSGPLQLQAYMPQGIGSGSDLTCSVIVDGETLVSNQGDAGSVNCNTEIAGG